MTDNARIVREALDNCTAGYAEESSNMVCSGCGASFACKPDCPVQEAITALDCLETELATAKADLERAREEERERVIRVAQDLYTEGAGHPSYGKRFASMLRAALAPEQKG